jgi:hypothetical protein
VTASETAAVEAMAAFEFVNKWTRTLAKKLVSAQQITKVKL